MCWCLQPSCWTWHAIWMESIPLHQNCLCASAFGSAMDYYGLGQAARRPGPKWEVLNSAALGYGFWTMFWPMDRMTWWDDPGPSWFFSGFPSRCSAQGTIEQVKYVPGSAGKIFQCWSHGEALEFFKLGYYMMVFFIWWLLWLNYPNYIMVFFNMVFIIDHDGVFYMVFIVI